MSEQRPVLLGGSHMRKAMFDDEFYKNLPQFLPIRAKLHAMHEDRNTGKGCPTCRQRRIQNNIERDFVAIASSLGSEYGKIFKNYFGVSRMVVHAVNPETHAAYLKDI